MDLVRVDFALLPASPLFDDVITASQSITARFPGNANIIDAKVFPPHLSLHICRVPPTATGQIAAALQRLAAAGLPEIAPLAVEPAGGGWVMLRVERTPALLDVHEAAMGIAARARDGLDSDRHGSRHVRNTFAPHISLAKLGSGDQASAVAIARRHLGGAAAAAAQALELCDIGERSERWDVLASFRTTAIL
jgi:hypothetical protein